MRTFDERITDLLSEIAVDNWEIFFTSLLNINKRLNSVYYSDKVEEVDKNHLILAGSMGRGTGIKGISDIDVCYVLPIEVYERFINRQGNIQSQLLAEIKSNISTRYPKTDLNSDGQVVDINFDCYKVELVLCFRLSSWNQDELTHPDSNEGGSWQRTYPKKSIFSIYMFKSQHKNYAPFCRLFRTWRDNNNVRIKGIVIDLLLKEFFPKESCQDCSLALLSQSFEFLSNVHENPFIIDFSGCEQIEMHDFGFKNKARTAYRILNDLTLDYEEKLCAIFGSHDAIKDNRFDYENDEQYIEDSFPNQPIYESKLDCEVSCKGFRTYMLKEFLSKFPNRLLNQGADLKFVCETTVPKPYEVYWKVRNVGDKAKERNCLRGTIEKTNSLTQEEHTDFYGPHFVEVYIVKDGLCIARNKINVPIGEH